MQTNFPEGFQERFFRVSTSNTPETLHREGNNIYVPAGLKVVEYEIPEQPVEGESSGEQSETPTRKETRAAWIQVILPYQGDDLSDLNKFYIARYSDLRRFFYGSALDQCEMQSDKTWAAHCDAVKIMFPKTEGEVPETFTKFQAYKHEFWTLISGLVAQYGEGKTLRDINSTFNADYLKTLATEWNVPAEVQLQITLSIQTLTLNLIANGYAWENLFPIPVEFLPPIEIPEEEQAEAPAEEPTPAEPDTNA